MAFLAVYLQDILENDNVKLDWSFKMSFISDIIGVSINRPILIFYPQLANS